MIWDSSVIEKKACPDLSGLVQARLSVFIAAFHMRETKN